MRWPQSAITASNRTHSLSRPSLRRLHAWLPILCPVRNPPGGCPADVHTWAPLASMPAWCRPATLPHCCSRKPRMLARCRRAALISAQGRAAACVPRTSSTRLFSFRPFVFSRSFTRSDTPSCGDIISLPGYTRYPVREMPERRKRRRGQKRRG